MLGRDRHEKHEGAGFDIVGFCYRRAYRGLRVSDGRRANKGAAVRIDNDDIGGVVTSAKGPEAGVWVIAETTRSADSVRQDGRDRRSGPLRVPDLPKATYNIWVRGYGLVDSPKVKATPGKNLKPQSGRGAERSRRGAILSGDLLVLDDEDSRQERVRRQGKIPAKITQNEYLNLMKSNGCANCHSIGSRSMRTFPENVPFPLGKFANSEEAWFRRIQSGQGGVPMFATASRNSAARLSLFCGLDGPHRQRRAAPCEAAAARRVSSATSSSRPGIGSTTSITCTT